MEQLRASNAPRWMKCAASVHFVPPRPEVETDAAREGTCAAWLADQCNKTGAFPTMFIGQACENGWVVDENMAAHVTGYLDVINRHVKPWTEVFMQHPTLPVFGTCDAMMIHNGVLYITDLKYGYGLIEAATAQLVAYLMLAMRTLDRNTLASIHMVQLSIYQPRAMHRDGHYRKRVISMDEVWFEVTEMESRIVELLNKTDPVAVPGPQCLNCAKGFSCAALTGSVYEMWVPLQDRIQLTPTEWQLSTELEMLETMETLLKARKTAVEAEVQAKLEEGTYIPGWVMEAQYGNRAFTVDPITVQMLTGVDPFEKKLVTPAELERRKADKAKVKTITHKPLVGHKLRRAKSSDEVAAKVAAAKAGE